VAVPHRREDRLPDFLVIGAMKAGTTSLYHYLAAHPEIFMASVKELDFFVAGANWRRGLSWYARQFDTAGDATVAGEASTAYTKDPIVPGVPGRIAAVLPSCRFVYVVRDPIDRIRSHYEHRVAIGTERAPIERAVLDDPVYVTCSRYADQIERYLEEFDRDRLFLLTAERLRADRAAALREVFTFLGVDPDVVPATIDTEYYRTTGRARFPPIVGALRHALKEHVPAAKRAKELVDSTLPRLVRSRGSGRAPANARVVIPDETRVALTARLQDDLDRLDRYLPGAAAAWSVGPQDRSRS
jgi:sulfotransferase family protein